MLLSHFKPEQVCDWFMELFIDAYDWVMVPNVYGMSQFADGGIFTTKPYISGSNYVKKMSDYATGEWCQTLGRPFLEFHRPAPRIFPKSASSWHDGRHLSENVRRETRGALERGRAFPRAVMK